MRGSKESGKVLQQRMFDALWEEPYSSQIRVGQLSVSQAEKLIVAEVNKFCKELRARGISYSRSCSRQLREWWGLGVPCGLFSKAYLVSWRE